ncbi:MAG: hypothetical protein IJ132_05620 [Firmicutes bacterium]|nr:hypothetical protein [Bacillota bacterium]
MPNIYTAAEMVEVTGNIARRGGGLASDGKFYFGPFKSTADLNAKMTVSKVWTPSANTEPIAIRIIAKQGSSEVVVADVPLDGIENPPVSEFDTVSELAPDGNTWTGEFALPYVVTDANGDNIKLFSLFHNDEEIDLTLLTGRQKLGDLLKENKQDEVVVQATQGVTLIFKEMNVEKDGDGNLVATDVEHSTHTFTPNNIDFSSLKLTKEKAEETMEDVIGPDGAITQKPSFGTYTAGLALQLETGNDNEANVEK